MKRILSIIICICLIILSSSCSLFSGDKEKETVLETTSKRVAYITRDEVQKLAEQGKVSGATFALGTDAETIKKHYLDILKTEATTVKTKVVKKKGTTKNVVVATETTQNPEFVTYIGDDESYYEYYKGTSLTSVSYIDEKYFFVNNQFNKGAAIAVCTSDAYNFKIGNCYSDDIIHSLGEPDYNDVPTQDQLFFCLGTPVEPTRLTYIFGTKRLDFILSNDKLSVVVLTDTSLYNGFKNVPATTSASAQSTISTTK